jgi:hypothetical protein
MKPIAAPIVGGMIASTIHVLILVPVFFVLMKERANERCGAVLFGRNRFCNASASSLVESAPRRAPFSIFKNVVPSNKNYY